jgi:hypothetical protein
METRSTARFEKKKNILNFQMGIFGDLKGVQLAFAKHNRAKAQR